MLRVYLDQNHWIYLAQALDGRARSQEEADAALVIKASVERQLASYPLSLAHLEETWRQRRADKRVPLADTMAAVSRNHTIAPPTALLPASSTVRCAPGSASRRTCGRSNRLVLAWST